MASAPKLVTGSFSAFRSKMEGHRLAATIAAEGIQGYAPNLLSMFSMDKVKY